MGGFTAEGLWKEELEGGQSPIESVGICQIQKERMLGIGLWWMFLTMSSCEKELVMRLIAQVDTSRLLYLIFALLSPSSLLN